MGSLRTDWIGRGLAVWVAWVLQRRGLVLVLAAVAGALSLGYARGHLGINTDTADMISPSLPWRQDFIAYRDAFPSRDRNLLVVVDAPAPATAERFAAALAKRLEAMPELYPAVFVVGGGEFFERNGLLYLSLPELESLTDRLTAAQPFIGQLENGLSGVAVLDLAGEAAARSTSASAQPVEGLFSALTATLDAAAHGAREPLDWRALFAPGTEQRPRAMLLIRPRLEFDRAQPAELAIGRLREQIVELRKAFPQTDARLTGTVAMEHEELVSVMHGASLAGLLALGMVVAILFLALRSVVMLWLSVVTLLLGLAGTAAFAGFAVGHLNLLSVAFAVLYVGLGVDFILHIGLRLKELMAAGVERDAAIVETVRGVGSTLAVCAITTAAGFYSFIPTPFKGVSELGIISGTGMFISLFVSVTVLPALLGTFYRGPKASSRGPWLGERLFAPALAHPRGVIFATALIGIAALASLPAVTFDHNPIHLRDPSSESVQTLLDLAASGEALPLNLVALAPDAATARTWARELEALPEVRAAQSLDSLVPSEQQDKLALLEDTAILLGPRFGTTTRVASEPSALANALGGLRARIRTTRASTAAERALAEAITALERRLSQAPSIQRDEILGALDEDLVGELPPLLARLSTALEARPFGRADLPPELARRWLDPRGEELLEISPQQNTDDNDVATEFVSAVRAVVPHVTGLPVVNLEASKTVIEAFKLAFLYALVTVLVILLATGLGIVDALLVLGPVVLAAAVTGGATVWLGLPFNFANIIALPLLLGIGVDNGIHIIHRMREDARDGTGLFATSTSKAVLASGVTTIASFGNLAFSSHVGMASMGKLLTLGIIVTLAASLITLPALLTLMRRP